MNLRFTLGLAVACLAVRLTGAPVHAAGALDAVPQDALAFVVIHDLADASAVIDDVATIVQAPSPGLLAQLKQAIGLQKGVDEHGDIVVIFTSLNPVPKFIILTPIVDFSEFFAALGVAEPTGGGVEVQLAGTPTLVGRKGSFAAMTFGGREELERYLTADTSLASDDALSSWLHSNQASVVITAPGVKTLFPMLINGGRAAQASLMAAGPNAKAATDALNMYISLFIAAQTEVEQLAFGVRANAERTVALVKRVQFVPDGSWAKTVADVQPATGDPLAGLPAGPFAFAFGGAFPERAMDRLMSFSVEMMRNIPGANLTPEQARKYGELSMKSMTGARSMAMVVGVPEPGAGIYGKTTAVMTFDDAQHFIDEYGNTIAELSKLAEETKSPTIPVGTTQPTTIGDVQALEVTMQMPNVQAAAPAGAPDMQKMMQLMAGPDGTLKIYLAAADEHAVVMAYTSPELLTSALSAYKSQNAGLSSDAQVAVTSAALPSGAQFVGFVDLNGAANMFGQLAAATSPGGSPNIPNFAAAPPIGFAAKIHPLGVEGSLVIPAETLRSIGAAVHQAHGGP